ncbi:MAG: hypothetical protein KAJ53_02060 [Anaerolineales bacterium]|nr:hypothetical protein [Anaerolineales bacterium]
MMVATGDGTGRTHPGKVSAQSYVATGTATIQACASIHGGDVAATTTATHIIGPADPGCAGPLGDLAAGAAQVP